MLELTFCVYLWLLSIYEDTRKLIQCMFLRTKIQMCLGGKVRLRIELMTVAAWGSSLNVNTAVSVFEMKIVFKM